MARKVDIGLTTEVRTRVCGRLERVVADLTVLAQKLHAFHWLVRGEEFPMFHALFGDQYDAVSGTIDTVAERCRQLGGYPPHTLKKCVALSGIKEFEADSADELGMVEMALLDHEACARYLRESIKSIEGIDCVTANMMQEWCAAHEKAAWFLRSCLA